MGNLPLGELVKCPVGTYVVGTYVHAVTHAEQRGVDALLVCVSAHSVLKISHALSKELVDLVEVDGKVFGSHIHHFGLFPDADQWAMSADGEGGYARGEIISIAIGKPS